MKPGFSGNLLLIVIFLIPVFFIIHSCKVENEADSNYIIEQLDLPPDENQVSYSPDRKSTRLNSSH